MYIYNICVYCKYHIFNYIAEKLFCGMKNIVNLVNEGCFYHEHLNFFYNKCRIITVEIKLFYFYIFLNIKIDPMNNSSRTIFNFIIVEEFSQQLFEHISSKIRLIDFQCLSVSSNNKIGDASAREKRGEKRKKKERKERERIYLP